MVIRGDRDRVFQQPLFAKVTESIPGAQDADIGVSGHMVMLERRDAVNRTIERFLEDEGQRSWRGTADELQKKKPGRDRLQKIPQLAGALRARRALHDRHSGDPRPSFTALGSPADSRHGQP